MIMMIMMTTLTYHCLCFAEVSSSLNDNNDKHNVLLLIVMLMLHEILSQGGLGPFDYRIGDVENFLKKSK